MTQNHSIAQALTEIRNQMATACHNAHRQADEVQLVAVSKFHPQEAVREALKAGQRIFGENRVQEAAAKFPALREEWPELKLHLIGSLQTNKAVEACALADVIESLDRPSLSTALEKAAQKTGRLPELFVQVNIGDEPQKSGISPLEADRFIEDALSRFGSRIKGLMAIPPLHADPRPFFQKLARLNHRHGLPALSMGMSADFEIAIAEGATIIRVGTAIFGDRPASP
ncbi:YggS family pyridoxal phosphate-dependent enzyme [Bombella sp. ESL0385]|uniref:YggS family pyridoxal phosphate-dependent enzyme n=1 Tax=Bombella sp. ESL0385 TaxID=2676446 RepID=UPI0012D9BD34|nr:YggS family pyridoxal phosphate-dependent enzyme [Bombella sp. ESL0385]MUG89732.1 YggS family pyridoxal phosphate-dependent enzyme [Bombella sp. ESL0385]